MLFKKWWKKIDKLITSVLIWWAVASIFWLSKTIKKKKVEKVSKTFFWDLKEDIWDILVKIVSIFSKKKK